ncbi:MAG: SDR family NAD(P)-dependent oxidoreductase [Dehalococcoidales bacterium]|nr:SDR family NAD(P)-dependent oxidoreductase [Dehalococcoidales bacterium]
MGDRLKNRVAAVTGSGQGIGRAVALALAQEGAILITNNRRPGTKGGDAETTAQEIRDMGGQAAPFFGDVASFEEARQMVQKAVDEFGRLDIVVNNAGTDAPHMVWNMTEEEWDRSVNSYLKGTWNCIRHACVLMREQKWGRIINTTSVERLGAMGHCNYVAAKAGVVGLTRAIARELGRYGVTCNAYAPLVATRFTLSEDSVQGFKKRYEAGLITKEQLDEYINLDPPETVGPLVAYLCTQEAGDINGQVFDVTKGNISIYSEPERVRTLPRKDGLWTVEDLVKLVPEKLLPGYKNPAPAQLDK